MFCLGIQAGARPFLSFSIHFYLSHSKVSVLRLQNGKVTGVCAISILVSLARFRKSNSAVTSNRSSGPWNLFKKRNCFRHSKEENVLHKQIINNLLLINKTLQIQLYVPCPIFIFLFPSPKVTTALTIQNNYIYVNSIIMSLFFSCRHMYILKMDL